MAKPYLQDAINKVEQSEGDVTHGYQEQLIRQAFLRLMISIAQDLEWIRMTLEESADRESSKQVRRTYGSGE